MPFDRLVRLTGFLALVLIAPALVAEDWPQWLGPDRSGAVPGLLALEGAEAVEFEPVWRRPLGSGYSSLAVRGERAVTMASLDDGDYVLALDRDSGRELWRHRLGDTFLGRSGSDDGPASTPTVSSDTVFALEPSGQLVALDLATGRERWKKHLESDFGAESHTYGYSTAPVWTGSELVVAAGGGAAGSMVVSLDGASGELNWAAGSQTQRHQTPAVATVGGVEQVIVPHNRGIESFALGDGRSLWSLDFEEASGSGEVIVLDADSILVSRWGGNSLIRVRKQGADLTPELVWSTNNLGNTYAVPVRHGDYLYGFKRRFLTCVELASGETVWKSRQPGGQALTLAGDTLWIVSPDGELVVAEASPEGYRELGRVSTFDPRRVYTPPTLADGLVFVRNLEEAAAWRPRSGSRSEDGSASPASGVVADLEARLREAVDDAAVLREFVRQHPAWPIVEADRVHFLYRGDVEDIAVVGDMTGGHLEMPMLRLGETDLYYRTFPAPDEFRWEYRFRSFESSQVDRRNRNILISGGEPVSVVERYEPAGDDIVASASPSSGRVTLAKVDFSSGGEGPQRSATLYLPEAPPADGGYPLVLWFYGHGALDEGSLGDLASGLAEPAILAFLHLPESYAWDHNREALAEALSESILPALVADYGASSAARDRAIVTQEWGATNVLHWALTRQEVGMVALQSPFFGEHAVERMFAPMLEDAPIDLYIELGESDDINRDWGLDVAAQSEQLAAFARKAGLEVTTSTSVGGSNWTLWAAGAPAILARFLGEE